MKKTKYLVLSAAAILAVGCKGNAKMPKLDNNEDAVKIAQAIMKAHEDATEVPYKQLTVTKDYYETYEGNFGTGYTKWDDKETYKLEVDLDNYRMSYEVNDSDSILPESMIGWEEYTGPKVYKKLDMFFKDSKFYICMNLNNIYYGKYVVENVTSKELALSLLTKFYMQPDEQFMPGINFEDGIPVPYLIDDDGELSVEFYSHDGIWDYISGGWDQNLDYVFEYVIYRTEPMIGLAGFQGYLPMVAGMPSFDNATIMDVTDGIAEKIKAGETYTEGSYANYYLGSNDKDKKTSLYCENNYKLGYIVDIDDATIGDEAKCNYQTNLNFTYVDNYLTKAHLDHNQDITYRLADQATGEYKKRTVSQDVTIKHEAKIADVNPDDYIPMEL